MHLVLEVTRLELEQLGEVVPQPRLQLPAGEVLVGTEQRTLPFFPAECQPIEQQNEVLRMQVIQDVPVEDNAKGPLLFGQVEDHIELHTPLYLADGEHCELLEVLTGNLDRLLQQYVYVLEMRDHKLFILDCLAL